MTIGDLPNREELLEIAPLEALGLLDEVEERRFTLGFDAATTSIQDEVRDLQAAVAVEFGSVGEDTPDRALRYRVLAAMSAAVEADDVSCAPIASIGSPGPQRSAVSSRQNAYDAAIPGLAEEPARRERDTRSSTLWRAAALALGSGLLVTLYFTNQLSLTARNLAQLALLDLNKSDLREQIGPSYAKFIESGTAAAVSLSGESGSGAAVIFIEPSSNEGLFLAFDLGEDTGPFRLVARDQASGEVVDLAVLDNFSELAAVQIDLTNVPVGSTFALLDMAGRDILVSQV